MDYNYGLCGLLICSCIWFQMNVAYIYMFVHVVLRLNIHLIFVYGLHQKNRGNYAEIFYLKYVLISGISFTGSK